MKRATITLPDELEEAVESYRRAQDVPLPLTAVTQAALREYLERRGFTSPAPGRPFRITPAGEGSGEGDVSAEHDRHFAEAAGRVSMVLADTGPLYAALDPTDDNHDRAQRDIERLNEKRIEVAVAYPTLCEGYSLVLHKLGIERAHAWLGEIRGHAALLNPTVEDYRAAADRTSGYRDQGLSLFDALAAVVSEQRSLAVWTYDHHFDVMGAEVWRGA